MLWLEPPLLLWYMERRQRSSSCLAALQRASGWVFFLLAIEHNRDVDHLQRYFNDLPCTFQRSSQYFNGVQIYNFNTGKWSIVNNLPMGAIYERTLLRALLCAFCRSTRRNECDTIAVAIVRRECYGSEWHCGRQW